MLKSLPKFNFNIQSKIKCGEIFCHNSIDFTIYCTFCEIKSFSFEDFLQHLKSLHFANDLYTSKRESQDSNYYVDDDKNSSKYEVEGDQIYDSLIQCYNDDADEDFVNELSNGLDDDFCDDSYDQPLVILKEKQKVKRRIIEDVNYFKSNKCEEEVKNLEPSGDYQSALTENEFNCQNCGENFKTAGHLKTHMNCIHDDRSSESVNKKEKTGKQISCNECDQVFPYKKSLYSHIVEYHLGFKCSMCDKRFKQLQQRDRHEFCHTAQRVFFCDIAGCNKSFTHKYYLQRHIDSHNKERKFVCDFENCTKAFHTQRCLKAHKNRHTKPKNLICDTCGYTCREYDRLRIHQRVHTGEKPYGCQECGKRFTSNAALLEHSVLHTGVRSHVCIYCNASFTRQKSLYQHRLKCTTTTVEST